MADNESEPRPASEGDLPLDNGFWRFSLAVYAGDGVAAECLALQESRGIDVNLLLYCAWMGWRGVVLTEQELTAAAQLADNWHQTVVRSLRTVRQGIKTSGVKAFEPFRNRVKSLELQAEQIEQALLFRAAPKGQHREPVARTDAIDANIAQYLGERDAPRLKAAAFAVNG